MRSSERSVSIWEATRPQASRPRLEGTAEAEVCIVGAGLAGLTTAYLLARHGTSVVVLDADAVGSGETGQTTAHLASANDDYFHVLERIHGLDGSRLIYESHDAAIAQIGEIARTEQLDCGYERVDGYLFLAPGTSPELLATEHAAAGRAGAEVELVDGIPGVPFASGPALRFARQAQFHPLKYLEGLARCLERDGGRIHTGNHVTDIEGGDRPRASGDGFEVRARAVVVCTNSPVVDRIAIHTKQAPYRTFAIAARIPPGAVPHVLMWDTLDPYHYVRVAPAGGNGRDERLVVGGEDHKAGHADDGEARLAALEAWARARFPMMGAVEQRWSGQVMEPADHVAFIGRDPGGRKGVYVATGDSGQGMTHATIAGLVISDLIQGRANRWASLYDPNRKSLSATSVTAWISENADVAAQYADLVPGVGVDVRDTEAIQVGQGAVLQRGAGKVAVFRQDDGRLVERSAFCTHLGCVVRWNSLERSWDCPCHGSRFAPTGEVLNGPAVAPLKDDK